MTAFPGFGFARRRVEAVGYADAEGVTPVGLLYCHARHEQPHDLLTCGESFGRVVPFDFGYALSQRDEPRVGRVGKLGTYPTLREVGFDGLYEQPQVVDLVLRATM